MRRRDMILGSTVAFAWPLAARAQERGRTYRVGAVSPVGRDSPPMAALLGEMRRRGFVEGQNLAIDPRGFGQRPEQFAEAPTAFG